MPSVTKSYYVIGKVQGVMFRQTFIRACQRFNLVAAGATNSKLNKNKVTFTIKAKDEAAFNAFMSHFLGFKGKAINSWGGKWDECKELSKIIPIEKHQVTMENVDKRKWKENVEFYL